MLMWILLTGVSSGLGWTICAVKYDTFDNSCNVTYLRRNHSEQGVGHDVIKILNFCVIQCKFNRCLKTNQL